MSEESNSVDEARKKKRVSSTGKVTKRLRCKPGYKANSAGTSCVPQSSSEKKTRRKAAKKAARKRRTKSQASSKRKRIKALKKRRARGL